MTDRPIIFSAPMIKSLIAGRKSQTRRLNIGEVPEPPAHDAVSPWSVERGDKLHPAPYLDSYCGDPKTSANPRGMSDRWCWWTRDDRPGRQFKVSYVPGDRLWVRETFARVGDNSDDVHACPDMRVPAYYRADSVQPETLKWRSTRTFTRLAAPEQ